MENKIVTIEEGIGTFTNGKVECKKVINYMSLVWLAVGVLMLVAQRMSNGDGALSMFLLVAGLCLAAYGAISLFIKKTGYFCNGKPMKLRKFMFDADRYADVWKLYEAGEFSNMVEIPHDSAAKMMLKILVANDYSIAYSQVYKFSSQNYDFEPTCEIREHDAAQCQKINTLVISY